MSGDTGESGERPPPGSPPRPPPRQQLPRNIPSSPYSRILQANNQYPSGLSQQNLLRPSNNNNLEIIMSQPMPAFPQLDSSLYPQQQQSSTSYSLLQPSHFVPSGSCYGIGAAALEAHRRATSDQPSGSNSNINVPWTRNRIPGGLDTDPVRETSDNINTAAEILVMGKSKMVQVEEDVFSAFMDLDYMDAPTTTTTTAAANEVPQGAFDFGDHKMIGVEGGDTDENSSADERWRRRRRSTHHVSSMPPEGIGTSSTTAEDHVSQQQMNLHLRSVSDDSFLENTDLADDFLDLPPYPVPAAGTQPAGQIISSMITTSSQSSGGLTLGGVSFTGDDLNKILENPRLSEIALRDPRRAKRILSNRRSAARSKERKLKYVAELEQRIATLQNERTMLASQLAQLQQEAAALANQNNELKFRLQAMEQQAHLQEALKAALAEELQRLRQEREAYASSSRNIHHQLSSETNETGEMQQSPTAEPQESKDDEATPSAEDEPKQ